MTKQVRPEVWFNVATSGELRRLRERLGLSRAAMAEFMYISPVTYANVEKLEGNLEGPYPRMWVETIDRVERFVASAQRQLALLDELEISIEGLMPLFAAATLLGLPQEVVLGAIRRGEVEHHDLGVLGQWIPRETMKDIRL